MSKPSQKRLRYFDSNNFVKFAGTEYQKVTIEQ